MKVKGSIFVDLVRLIKKDKNGVYDAFLKNEDREIISDKIISSNWYPYETYKRCLKAIFQVVANNDLMVGKEWGRAASHAVMTTIYSGILSGRDPLSFMKKYEIIHRNFYDFGQPEVVVEGPTQVLCRFSGYDSQFVLLFHISQGWLEQGLELCGAKNIKSEFVTKSWEGHPTTSIRFIWT